MARRRRDRKPQPTGERPACDPDGTADGGRLRPWLAGATSALFVAQPLVANESAGTRGDGLAVVMLWITLGVVWLLGAIGRSQFRVRFGWTDAAVLALIGWHTVAAVWAANTGSPRLAINVLWVWVGFGLSFFLARQFLVGRREIRAMLVVMIALAVALSGYAVYQRVYELPASWEAYGNDKVAALREAGIEADPDSTEAILFERRLFSFEPLGTFALANSLAGYLAPWLVVALGIGFGAGLRGGKRLRNLLAAFSCAMLIALCLLWTRSRSGCLATLLGLPLVWWLCRDGHRAVRSSAFRRRRPAEAGTTSGGRKLLAVGAVGTIVLAAGLLAARMLDARVLTQASLSLEYRLQYWQASLAMIGDHLVMGCGPGQFQNAYTVYKLPAASEEIADPHNFLLEAWATAGTPAALALLAVLGCFAWTHWGLSQFSRSENGTVPFTPSSSSLGTHSGSSGRLASSGSQAGAGAWEPGGGRDAAGHMLVGGAAGFLLALPLGLISSTPPNPAAVLLGLPLAAAVVGVLWVWIRDGRLPTLLPVVGVVVLLVNLLASGGMGFPGVSGTFWLLLALGLNAAEARPAYAIRQKAALGALAFAVLLALACHMSAYGPVLECRGHIEAAYRAPARLGDHPLATARFEDRLLAATAADPLDPDPWNRLAALALALWQEKPSQEAFGEFETYSEKFLRRTPKSASARAMAAERYFAAFRSSGREDSLRKAVDFYRQAVEFYPTNPTYRANLALALRAAEDHPGFEREAARALELDALTPHLDKKLDGKLRATLQRSRVPGGLGP